MTLTNPPKYFPAIFGMELIMNETKSIKSRKRSISQKMSSILYDLLLILFQRFCSLLLHNLVGENLYGSNYNHSLNELLQCSSFTFGLQLICRAFDRPSLALHFREIALRERDLSKCCRFYCLSIFVAFQMWFKARKLREVLYSSGNKFIQI